MEHQQSKIHTNAVALGKQPALSATKSKLDEEAKSRKNAVVTALKAVYFLSAKEVANCVYPDLLELLRHLKVPGALRLQKSLAVKYDSPHIFNQLLAAIADVSLEELMRKFTKYAQSDNVNHFVMTLINWNALHIYFQVHKKKLQEQLRKSPFVGIGVDESTDRTMEKHLVTVVRYIEPVTGELMSIAGYMGYVLQQIKKICCWISPWFFSV